MREKPLREILGKLGISVERNSGNGWLICKCPFAEYLHERGTDHSPSFCVHVDNEKRSGYSCFTCKSHGNIMTLVGKLAHYREEQYPGLEVEAALAEIPDEFGSFDDNLMVEEPPEPMDAGLFAAMYPKAWTDRSARAYLKGRGITLEASEALRLRFDPDQSRILFPVIGRDGKLYGHSGRSTLPGEILECRGWAKVRDYGFRKGKVLLGEHLIAGDALPLPKPLFLVEGLFAMASVVSAGVTEYAYPIATLGSSVTDAQIRRIASFDTMVYLCMDNDGAGEAGIYGRDGEGGALQRLQRQGIPVRVPLYPPGVDDPDSLTLPQIRRMLSTDYE